MSLILKDCRYLLTQDSKRRVLRGVDVLIEDKKIARVGKGLEAKSSGDPEVIDCSDSVVMPGLVNTHTHIAMSLFRGVADDVKLDDFLKKTYALDAKFGEKDVYRGALLGCLEAIKFGTTTFNDLYYSEDQIAKAAVRLGMRASLAWAVLDKEFTTQKGDPLKNCARFIADWTGKSELITPAVGLQGVYVCSEETYSGANGLAEKEDTQLHTHLSETRKEVYDHVKKTGKRPVEFLDDINFLSDRIVAAHCVWLTKREMDTLAKSGVKVSHNPTSNLKLASGGLCPVLELLERKVCVSLGTDSVASNNSLDLFKEMRLASLLQKNYKWDATLVPAQAALDMATIDGARALGMADKIGSIEEGKLADIIIIGLADKPHLTPVHSIVSNIVFSASGSDVDTSIINGRVVMRDRAVEGEKTIIREASK